MSNDDFNNFVADYDQFYKNSDKLGEGQQDLTNPESDGYKLAVAFVDKWRGPLDAGIKAAKAAGETSQSGVQHHEIWEALGGLEENISDELKNRGENKWS